MKSAFVIAAIVLQVALLAFMAGEREWIARTGHVVYLQGAPVDPRDVMRGDYVALGYDISTASCAQAASVIAATNAFGCLKRDTPVYAVLRTNEHGVAELTSLELTKPASGLFIRGYIAWRWYGTYPSMSALDVRYGIEAYYMEQGKALEFEQTMRKRTRDNRVQMAVALSPGGVGVITGWR